MPEGVEVKIIIEQLNSKLINRTIKEFRIVGGRYLHKPDSSFAQITFPLKINNINCKGKFIYWSLENDWFIFNTLGMTGSWLYSISNPQHKAIEFLVDDFKIVFDDIRHFGTLRFIKGKDQLNNKLDSLGADMLSNPPNEDQFYKIINKNKTSLAEILMNQKNISGIGNYIKAESLYRAQLSPWRLGNSLNRNESDKLRINIIEVMQESYQAQGATLANYKDILEQKGSFANHFKVYGKEQDLLGNRVIKEETFDKRTTWWCPAIQQ